MSPLESPSGQSTAPNGGPAALRLFVAIQLPASVRVALREVQSELRVLLPPHSAAWTRIENLHLTLRFLGQVPSARLADLKARLRAALAGVGPLDLLCEGLGCFPDRRIPRVIWAGVRDANAGLELLHDRVNSAVQEFAERPAEARFVGHVTVARPKQISRAGAGHLARYLSGGANRAFGNWRCLEVELVSSELSVGGARYTTLDVFPL